MLRKNQLRFGFRHTHWVVNQMLIFVAIWLSINGQKSYKRNGKIATIASSHQLYMILNFFLLFIPISAICCTCVAVAAVVAAAVALHVAGSLVWLLFLEKPTRRICRPACLPLIFPPIFPSPSLESKLESRRRRRRCSCRSLVASCCRCRRRHRRCCCCLPLAAGHSGQKTAMKST